MKLVQTEKRMKAISIAKRGASRPRLLLVAACAALLGGAWTLAGTRTAMAQTAGGDPYKGTLTYWLWGESNVPGMDKWMATMVAKYTALHPDVHVNVVSQSDDTLIGAFRLAAQSHSGPDIDTQWSTLPTLTPYWNGSAVAISDYLPKSETSQWINASENTTGGKIIAMPLYLVGIPLVWNKTLFKQAGLNPDRAPATWDELLADCAALKAHGITPIGMGNKDGWFGAWLFSIYALQELDSLAQEESAIGDTGGFSMADFEGVLKKVYVMMQDLRQKGYVNSDVASLDLNQGAQLFPQKKAAIAFNTDSIVLSWSKILGEDSIGVAQPPVWGHGKLAGAYDVTQSSGPFVTSWAKDKLAAATFLAWLHQPDNLVSFYQIGAFPADKRFPISSISDPLAKRLLELDAAPNSIWLENYLPPQVDSDADLVAGELILSNSGTPDQAVAIWDRVVRQWRLQHPSEFKQFKSWAASGG
jgi:raffinose/stachyose/melibiose transport system substrate-binding protein